MARHCMLGQIDPARLGDYRRFHEAVWPEMLAALQTAGWRNYSLFLREDGLLVGYFEAEDLDAAQRKMSATEVNTRWQTAMAEFFVGDSDPAGAWEFLPDVFNLDDQLTPSSVRPGDGAG